MCRLIHALFSTLICIHIAHTDVFYNQLHTFDWFDVENTQRIKFVDVNEDGYPDAVLDTPQQGVHALLNDRQGDIGDLIALENPPDGPWGSRESENPVDWNMDGIEDLLLIGKPHSNGFLLLLGNDNGTYETGVKKLSTHPPLSQQNWPETGFEAKGDINNDGIVDKVETSFAGWKPFPHYRNDIYFGNTSDDFDLVSSVPGGTVALYDVNQDSNLDIIRMPIEGTHVRVHLGKGNGFFDDDIASEAGEIVFSKPYLGDFNGDGIVDLLFGTGFEDMLYTAVVSILFGNGDGTFELIEQDVVYFDYPETAEWAVELSSEVMAIVDANGDSLDDVWFKGGDYWGVNHVWINQYQLTSHTKHWEMY